MSRLRWVWASPPDDELLALSRELEAGRLPEAREVLKENRLRSVWRVPGYGRDVLLKHYRRRSGEGLKTMLLGGRAEREYRAMESFCRAGLPSARPLAFADRRQSGRLVESWFLSRFVPAARTLAEVLQERAGDEQACAELAEQAVRVVARMHAHPFLHRDLHSGNLLLDGAGRLVIIDLHSLWHVRRLSDRQRWDTLARLVYSLRETVSLDRAPQLAAVYARQRGDDPILARVQLSSALDRFARDYQRGRVARCLRTSSEFVAERVEGRGLHRRREYDSTRLSADIASHREDVTQGAALLGDAPAAQVSRRGPADRAGRVIKHYRRRGPWSAMRNLLGCSRARGAWIMARRCEVVGVPTPRALALAEEWNGSAWLVTVELHGSLSLRELANRFASSARLDLRGALAFALGHVVGRLDRAGLRHADLSSKNILIAKGFAPATRDRRSNPPPNMADVQLIDLDGMAVVRPHDDRALLRMLGQLCDLPPGITTTDRQRFANGFATGAGRRLPHQLGSRALQAGRERRRRREGRQPAARPPS